MSHRLLVVDERAASLHLRERKGPRRVDLGSLSELGERAALRAELERRPGRGPGRLVLTGGALLLEAAQPGRDASGLRERLRERGGEAGFAEPLVRVEGAPANPEGWAVDGALVEHGLLELERANIPGAGATLDVWALAHAEREPGPRFLVVLGSRRSLLVGFDLDGVWLRRLLPRRQRSGVDGMHRLAREVQRSLIDQPQQPVIVAGADGLEAAAAALTEVLPDPPEMVQLGAADEALSLPAAVAELVAGRDDRIAAIDWLVTKAVTQLRQARRASQAVWLAAVALVITVVVMTLLQFHHVRSLDNEVKTLRRQPAVRQILDLSERHRQALTRLGPRADSPSGMSGLLASLEGWAEPPIVLDRLEIGPAYLSLRGRSLAPDSGQALASIHVLLEGLGSDPALQLPAFEAGAATPHGSWSMLPFEASVNRQRNDRVEESQ